MFLPIAHNGVRWGLVPVSTTLLLTATAEKEKKNQKCLFFGDCYNWVWHHHRSIAIAGNPD